MRFGDNDPDVVVELLTRDGRKKTVVAVGLGVGLALCGIVVAALCYGLNAPFAREAALIGVGGADVVALRNLLMCAGLGVVAVALRIPLAAPRGERAALFGLGVTSAMVGAGYITAVGFIPVGVAVLALRLAAIRTTRTVLARLRPILGQNSHGGWGGHEEAGGRREHEKRAFHGRSPRTSELDGLRTEWARGHELLLNVDRRAAS